MIHEVYEEKISIEEKINEVKEIINTKGSVTFVELFRRKKTRDELIATFMAILELSRQKYITIYQKNIFDDIILKKVS